VADGSQKFLVIGTLKPKRSNRFEHALDDGFRHQSAYATDPGCSPVAAIRRRQRALGPEDFSLSR